MSRCTHEWIETDDPRSEIEAWACAECDLTSASCIVCQRATGSSLLICARCIAREERLLDDVVRILGQDQGSPGDDPDGWGAPDLSDLGGPSLPRSPMDYRVRVSGSRAGGDRRSAEDVHDALRSWVTMWSHYAGHADGDAVGYLKGRLLWAAHNIGQSQFWDYRAAIRKLRATALGIVGLAPHALADRCMHCGGRVVQDRADYRGIAYDTGLQDVARCTGCGMTWGDRTAFQRVVRQHLHELGDTRPDAWVTRDQIRTIYPWLQGGTLRQWIKRDRDRYARSIRVFDAWYDRWSAWQEEGNIGPLPDEPEIFDREIREEDGLLRLGDIHTLIARSLRATPVRALQGASG